MQDPAPRAWSRRAAAPLAGIVESYLAYRQVGRAPGLHRGLPSGTMTFIVSVGEPIDVVVHPDPAAARRTYRATVGGLHTTPALIRHTGSQVGVAVTVRPAAVRALFGLPAAALRDTSVELSELVGPVGDELWDRLQAAATDRERLEACDEVLTAVAARRGDDRPAPEVLRAWELLEASGGRMRVVDVARAVGWSRQHLGRRFRAEFGLGPKEAARVLRFERSVQLIRAHDQRRSLADVAAVCGYADQAHLTNDWKQLAGCSPTRWWADEQVPILQDGVDPDPAPWGHGER